MRLPQVLISPSRLGSMWRLCFPISKRQRVRDVITTARQTRDAKCGHEVRACRLKTLEAIKESTAKHGLEVHAMLALLRCITFFRFTRQSPHIVHEIPN